MARLGIFRTVDTVKQGRSEPHAKKAKKERKIFAMQIEPQSPSQASCIYQPAGPWREEEFFQLTQERYIQLVREEVARSRLKVNSVKHCEVSAGSRGDARGARAPTLFWVKKKRNDK